MFLLLLIYDPDIYRLNEKERKKKKKKDLRFQPLDFYL